MKKKLRCKKCGEILTPGMESCPFCGTPVIMEEVQQGFKIDSLSETTREAEQPENVEAPENTYRSIQGEQVNTEEEKKSKTESEWTSHSEGSKNKTEPEWTSHLEESKKKTKKSSKTKFNDDPAWKPGKPPKERPSFSLIAIAVAAVIIIIAAAGLLIKGRRPSNEAAEIATTAGSDSTQTAGQITSKTINENGELKESADEEGTTVEGTTADGFTKKSITVENASEESTTEGGTTEDSAATQESTTEMENEFPDNVVLYEKNGHHYALYNYQEEELDKSFKEWEKFCEEQGGYLVAIDDAEENTYVYNYLRDNGLTVAFIGYTDTTDEGNWKWVNGSDSTYTNWAKGQPNNGANNSDNSKENYAQFYKDATDGTWNDSKLGVNSYWFVCEWDY